MTQFNEELLEKQNVTDDQKAELEKLYLLLKGTVNTAKNLLDEDSLDYTTGHILANTVKDIEFMLQKNFNFPQNEDFHVYQFKLPGCECPKMDNEDSFGSPYKRINQKCPFHGEEVSDET